MIQPGNPAALGAIAENDGTNFAVFAGSASAVELCLFDEHGGQAETHYLPEQFNGVWHGFLPGCPAGQRYGYRAHGAWDPDQGLRHNPAKLLLDPYARALSGAFRWDSAVFDFEPEPQTQTKPQSKSATKPGEKKSHWCKNERDSAPFVPLSVVTGPQDRREFQRPPVPWSSAIIYEANVRGYTMRHPDISEAERGRLKGMSNGSILSYLKALGVTSLELMPVHAKIDEQFLAEKGLRNFWGYNSIHYFVPDSGLSGPEPTAEFIEMVDAIHDAGIEVILDVVYNHTGEGGNGGPTLSFRGLDNLAYYRTEPGKPAQYINDTGCGNTLNTDHIRAQNLVLDSLRYWHRDLGVDGFRFDLATVLGRTPQGFSKPHSLLHRISSDPGIWGAKLIAEPWDPGPGGYQLGRFPVEWAEWNDRYRDAVRRFWRGDAGQDSEFARRIHGSADLFEHDGRNPSASINFIAAHDGFTLMDVVSYDKRHNLANGEGNRDGQRHNHSCNHGVEGQTRDADILALRRRQRLNMLATLLFSQGTPMLLAGDEFGNSQGGNNNAYAQDNEIGWVDWSGLQVDPEFQADVRQLIKLRRDLPLLRQARYIHGRMPTDSGWCDIGWWHPDGRPMREEDWNGDRQLALIFSSHADQKDKSPIVEAVVLLYNASPEDVVFSLPTDLPSSMAVRFTTGKAEQAAQGSCKWLVASRSLMLLSGELEG